MLFRYQPRWGSTRVWSGGAGSNRAAAALGLPQRPDDGLWAINENGPFNDQGIAYWGPSWGTAR